MATDALPVHAALSAVMGDVQAVRKGDRNEAQGSGSAASTPSSTPWAWRSVPTV